MVVSSTPYQEPESAYDDDDSVFDRPEVGSSRRMCRTRARRMAPLAGQGTCSAAWSLDHARVELCMSSGVLHQVVAPHKPLLTEWTCESLLAGVGSVVPGKLV